MLDLTSEILSWGRKAFETMTLASFSKTYLRIIATLLEPTTSLADVLMRCKIEGYSEDVFITTSPDANSSDGQYAGSAFPVASATEPSLSPIAWVLPRSLN